jgi:NAD(P)-dependent dehydrogenase (short-subunit alcohol dehydrogenase family)
VVITGASAEGLGAQTALNIAAANPAALILLARDPSKVQGVLDQIGAISTSIKTAFVPIHLDDLASVRAAADEVAKQIPSDRIDVLINNAGIMAVPYSKTKMGVESQFATNHLGHFVLTRRLFPLLKNADSSVRVINVTSDGYRICQFRPDDVNFGDGKDYHPWSGYGQSKTANILFTKALAKRGVLSFAVHPGVIPTTHLGDGLDFSIFGEVDEITKKHTGKLFGDLGAMKTAEQGVATTLIAAFDPRITGQNGGYLIDCQLVKEADVAEHARGEMMVDRLWELSEELSGEKFDI